MLIKVVFNFKLNINFKLIKFIVDYYVYVLDKCKI